MNLFGSIFHKIQSTSNHLANQLQVNSMLEAKLLIEKIRARETVTAFEDVEFKVFSQWGDDGIIQYLINKIDIPYKTFVEFGVENYTEANTRFLLMNNNWSGLVMDGSEANMNYVKND